ncbi:MAG: N-formylglutamate amidohydrolase, partial [Paracoccaceae bacterium]
GASADIALGDLIEQAFETQKFRVSRNVPFAGAYITQRYGQPGQSKHVVQVELDRALYLDEVEVAPSERFGELKDRLKSVLRYVIKETAQPPENRLAAE